MSFRQQPERLTALLHKVRGGDHAAGDDLYRLVFDDLRRMANGLLSGERKGHTLQPTALVSEAWIRLAGSDLDPQDRRHFFRVASRAMRHVLVDHARGRRAQKRDIDRNEPFDEWITAWSELPFEFLDLDEALVQLAQTDRQLAEIVEMRFFSGMTLEEVGEVCGMSAQQVHRSWRLARAFLHRRLEGPSDE